MPKDRNREGVASGGPRAKSCLLCAAAVILALAVATEGSVRAEEAGMGSAPTVKAASADLYDIDASGTDIRLVLELLARQSGANIVVGPEITGQVNAHLKGMKVDSILEYLSAAQGFRYEKSGGIHLVTGKAESIGKEPEPPKPAPPSVEVLVWECRHANPTEISATIAKLFPSIKVAEGPSMVTPELALSTSGLSGGSEGGGSGGGSSGTDSTPAKRTATKVVLMGTASELEQAKAVLAQVDARRPQVEIQVAITEVNASASKDVGIQWSWSDIAIKETADTGIGFGKFVKEGMSITGALSALLKDGKGKLLAQPKVSVLDCEAAEILIGDRILFPKLIGYNQIGTPLYDKAEEKVGIYLQIAPKVAQGDEVVLTLYPQVSLVTGFLKTQAGDYPQISTREARTTVSVKSGETLAIGGLLRENEIVNASKLPLLGDIPIIGHLFRHTKKTKERTEIVILLSPRIAGDGS